MEQTACNLILLDMVNVIPYVTSSIRFTGHFRHKVVAVLQNLKKKKEGSHVQNEVLEKSCIRGYENCGDTKNEVV